MDFEKIANYVGKATKKEEIRQREVAMRVFEKKLEEAERKGKDPAKIREIKEKMKMMRKKTEDMKRGL